MAMITSLGELPQVREEHAGDTIALAGGVFDLLHPGHIDLFKRMKAVADIGVIALSSDTRVKQRKGPLRPIQNQDTRLTVVDAIRYVDYALVAPEPTEDEVPTVQIMRALRPDYFFSSETSWLDYPNIFTELAIDLRVVPRFSDEISTTATIEAVLDTHSER